MLLEELYPDVPSVEDILGVVKFRIIIEVEQQAVKEKYVTPVMHFMVHKIDSNLHDYAYECACLELGKFYVKSCDDESKRDDTITSLIQETANKIAESIRLNVFDHKNNFFEEMIQSDFMDEYWRVYRLYSYTQDSKHEIPINIHEQERKEIQEFVADINLSKETGINKNVQQSSYLRKVANE